MTIKITHNELATVMGVVGQIRVLDALIKDITNSDNSSLSAMIELHGEDRYCSLHKEMLIGAMVLEKDFLTQKLIREFSIEIVEEVK